MSAIIRAFTPEQLELLEQNSVIAANVGLTNFNDGSRARTLIQAVAEIASGQEFSFLDGLRRAIPVSYYDAFNFSRKAAVQSVGTIRLYRKPAAIIRYIGASGSCLLSITPTVIQTTCSGAPLDNFSFTLSSYPTVAALIAVIDALPNYTAQVIQNGSSASTSLFNYTNQEVATAINFQNGPGLDIMSAGAPTITIFSGVQFQVDGVSFITATPDTLSPGRATSIQLSAQCQIAGAIGNLTTQALKTESGKGTIVNIPDGISYGINDFPFTNGTDKETDDERRDRFLAFVRGLARSTVRGLEAGALSINSVRSVSIRPNFPNNGIVTVICDDGAGTITPQTIADVQNELLGDPTDKINHPGYVAAGIGLAVAGPNVIGTSYNIILYRIGSLSDPVQVQNNVTTVIATYVNTRRLGDDIVLSELTRRVKEAHPAIFDLSWIAPSANIPINASSLARTGGLFGNILVTLVTLTSVP